MGNPPLQIFLGARATSKLIASQGALHASRYHWVGQTICRIACGDGTLGVSTAAFSRYPTCEEWPFSTDINGRSFPAGTVGVRVYSSFGMNSNNTNQALFPVPSELPMGYTFRGERDHNRQPGQDVSFGQAGNYYGANATSPSPIDGASRAFHFRTADQLNTYWWGPVAQGDGTDGSVSAGGIWPSGPSTAWSPGYRYVRATKQWFGTEAEDSISLEIRSSSGGSALWSHTFTNPNTAQVDDSGYSGQIESTLGEMAQFYFYVAATTGGVTTDFSGASSFGIKSYIAPRVDIPFPWSCTGLTGGGGHLFAPGGYVAGYVGAAFPS
jgi:hypothetical protein